VDDKLIKEKLVDFNNLETKLVKKR